MSNHEKANVLINAATAEKNPLSPLERLLHTQLNQTGKKQSHRHKNNAQHQSTPRQINDQKKQTPTPAQHQTKNDNTKNKNPNPEANPKHTKRQRSKNVYKHQKGGRGQRQKLRTAQKFETADANNPAHKTRTRSERD